MERFIALLKQYRYGVLILVLGIGLMLMPTSGESKEAPAVTEMVQTEDLAASLERVLSKMDGVGKVSVLLTQAEGEITIYQTDTDRSGESIREDTVLTADSSRSETGLIRQILPPTYQGAVIVCQGGDRAAVKLAIVNAVSAVTGLTSDRITVVKMK